METEMGSIEVLEILDVWFVATKVCHLLSHAFFFFLQPSDSWTDGWLTRLEKDCCLEHLQGKKLALE